MAFITRCKRCANPSTRPNTFFNQEGLCPVCQYELQRKAATIDWNSRRNELKEIIQWGRTHSKCSYDCIVTVSGGKDSTRQALFVRDELGAKPLLVSCQYPPEQLTDLGAYNFSNLISLGFDTISVGPNPQLWKQLMYNGFIKYGNWAKSTEMALYAIPIHVAIAYQIPLIFYGENPALTIGEKHGRLDGDASQLKMGNTIRGGPSSLLDEKMTPQDTHFYYYPPDDDMQHANLRLVYLGYYMEDWSGHQNARFSIKHGLKIRKNPPEEIGDIWGFSCLDEDFSIVNQLLKYMKFGFGRVTDQVCEAINSGMMTRDEGLDLIKKYDGRCDSSFILRYCNYLGISEKEFWEIADKYRNHDLWEKNEQGEWVLKMEQ